MLTGVYRGLSALESAPSDSAREEAQVPSPSYADTSSDVSSGEGSASDRKRAPKGYNKRRAAEILKAALPRGLSHHGILAEAARSGEPIPEGTLRKALLDLIAEGRAMQRDDLYFSTEAMSASIMNDEAAGAPHEHTPAASSSATSQGEPDETTLAR